MTEMISDACHDVIVSTFYVFIDATLIKIVAIKIVLIIKIF